MTTTANLHRIMGSKFQRVKPNLCPTCKFRQAYGEWEGFCEARGKVLSAAKSGSVKGRCGDYEAVAQSLPTVGSVVGIPKLGLRSVKVVEVVPSRHPLGETRYRVEWLGVRGATVAALERQYVLRPAPRRLTSQGKFGRVRDVVAVNDISSVDIRFVDEAHHEIEFHIGKESLLALFEEACKQDSASYDALAALDELAAWVGYGDWQQASPELARKVYAVLGKRDYLPRYTWDDDAPADDA